MLKKLGIAFVCGLAFAAGLAVAQNRSVQLTQDPTGVIAVDSNNHLTIPNGRHLNSTNTAAPVVSSCGSGPTIVGTDTAALVTAGTGAVTQCTVTFNVAYAVAPRCTATLNTTNAGPFFITVTTTTIVANYASEASDAWSYICIGT